LLCLCIGVVEVARSAEKPCVRQPLDWATHDCGLVQGVAPSISLAEVDELPAPESQIRGSEHVHPRRGQQVNVSRDLCAREFLPRLETISQLLLQVSRA